MKYLKLLSFGLAATSLVLLTAFRLSTEVTPENEVLLYLNEDLKSEALEILQTKCNACHKKQNPFMVFNQKNMSKRADKINRVVFEEKRMPKGEDYTLTDKEYEILKNWILTQNNN